jgi:hypothetical protein
MAPDLLDYDWFFQHYTKTPPPVLKGDIKLIEKKYNHAGINN